MEPETQVQVNQPKNTKLFSLAQEIPEHRQAKLAGRSRVGPVRNIAPFWSNVNRYDALSTDDDTTILPKSVTLNTSQNTADNPILQEINNLKSKLASRETKLNEAAQNNAVQHQQVEDLLNQKKTAQAVVQNLKQQLTNMPDQQAQPQPNSQDLINRIAGKETEIDKIQTEVSNIKTGMTSEEQLQNEIITYKQQIRELSREQERLQQLIQSEQQKVAALNQKLQAPPAATPDEQFNKFEKLLENAIQTPHATELSEPGNKHIITVSPPPEKKQELPVLTQDKNAINGVVKDPQGKMAQNCVVIIKDKANHNLRALKTNQLGQFVVTTALPNGEYFIEVERKGLIFDTVGIYLNGDVLPPLEIVGYETAA